MIKSIIFDGKEGYIGEKYDKSDKPEKPRKDDYRYSKYTEDHRRVLDEEKYNADMERYKSEMSFYTKHKGEYKVQCSELLVGRTFEFTPDRINVIFGPNASGKSTILKAIAAQALCVDGFSGFHEPLEFRNWDSTLEGYEKALKDLIFKLCRTTSVVDWDGSPIYFHNFENRTNTGSFGDLTGSILNSVMDEANYILHKGRISAGQNMFFQLSKLFGIMSKTITYEDLLAEPRRRYGNSKTVNESWFNCFRAQENYYKSFPMAFDPNGQNTYLFDEVDKSMDILNVHQLYTKVFPDIIEKYRHQIIVISHSPVIMSNKVFNSKKYNIISMDEEYTKKCRKIFA